MMESTPTITHREAFTLIFFRINMRLYCSGTEPLPSLTEAFKRIRSNSIFIAVIILLFMYHLIVICSPVFKPDVFLPMPGCAGRYACFYEIFMRMLAQQIHAREKRLIFYFLADGFRGNLYKMAPPGGIKVIKTCIFDMDGTLTDTLEDIANAGNFALNSLGFPTHPIETYRAFIGHSLYDLLALAMPENARTQQNVNEVIRLWAEHYNEHLIDCTRPFAGVTELLKTLADNAVALCIVTNKTDHQARLIAETFFPEITFLSVMGERDGFRPKPNPADALACAQLSGAAPSECAFIGDSEADIHTGKNANMITVAVDWGFRTRECLEAVCPDFVASTPQELGTFLLSGRSPS